MRKVLIFGNSGSGKSTLAAKLQISEELAHLDLDTLAWLATRPPSRAPLDKSLNKIRRFMEENDDWVIEGCYTDLLELVSPQADEIIFMNLPVDECIANARSRPWEPHKYESKQAQDKNLAMLLDWIAQYEERDDAFSLKAHMAFYNQFPRQKRMITSNEC